MNVLSDLFFLKTITNGKATLLIEEKPLATGISGQVNRWKASLSPFLKRFSLQLLEAFNSIT